MLANRLDTPKQTILIETILYFGRLNTCRDIMVVITAHFIKFLITLSEIIPVLLLFLQYYDTEFY